MAEKKKSRAATLLRDHERNPPPPLARATAAWGWAERWGEAFLPAAHRQELEQRRAEMAAIVDASDDAIYAFDPRGVITSWNRGAEQLYGYAATEVLGRPVAQLVPAPDRSRFDRLLQQLRQGTHLKNLEGERRGRDQRRITVAATFSPILGPMGQTVAIAAIERDLGDRKQHEAALRACNETLEQRVAQRTRTLNLLYDIASAANTSDPWPDTIRSVLRRLAQHTGWSFAQAFLPADEAPGAAFYGGELFYDATHGDFDALRRATRARPLTAGVGLPGRVLQTGLPEWMLEMDDERAARPELAHAPPVATAAALPVLVGRRVVAVLEFLAPAPLLPDGDLLESMASIGTQLGRVAERKALERQVADATADEQRRIGQELHDSVAQQLTGVAMIADTMRQQLQAARPVAPEAAALLVEHIKQAQIQVRRLSRGLMPVEVDGRGLMSALDELAQRYRQLHQFDCQFICDEPVALRDNAAATHLYRIAQEALHNVVKHAQARRAVIRLTARAEGVQLAIHDDGVGMPPPFSDATGYGCRIMRYRAEMIGARLEFDSRPGAGAVVRCTLKPSEESENLV